MEFIDTHCHLFWNDFAADLSQVLQRARIAGVRRCIIPSTDIETFNVAAGIADCKEGIWLAAGVHPHDAGKADTDVLDRLREAAAHPRVVAIGEIGLDYHYNFPQPHIQRELFDRQLALAKSLDLPVIIHNRESDIDILEIVLGQQDGSLRGQFHCFGSDAAFARQVLDAGFHISFTGNVTYKKSVLDPVVSLIPDDRLLLETDAPFMAPRFQRGKRNEPSYLPVIAGYIAAVRRQAPEYVAHITTENAERLFRLDYTGADL